MSLFFQMGMLVSIVFALVLVFVLYHLIRFEWNKQTIRDYWQQIRYWWSSKI